MKLFTKTRIIVSIISFFLLGAVAARAAEDPVVIELHYQNGIKFYKRGLYDKAIGEFEKTLSLDPNHQEARDYLEKVKKDAQGKKLADSRKSTSEDIRKLYEEGKTLYLKRDYKAAIEVFNKILDLKPIDDFASFYKEKCEDRLARQIARDRKIADRQAQKERAAQEKQERKNAQEAKKLEQQQMRKKSKEITEENRRAAREKTSVTQVQETPSREAVAPAAEVKEKSKAELKREALEEKKAQAEQKKEEKRKAAEEQCQEKIKARQDKALQIEEAKKAKKEAVQKAREDKAARGEEKKAKAVEAKKEKEESKEKKKEQVQEQKNNRELFLKGVEQYGTRDFEGAIASFKAVIDAEASGKKVYTNSAKRLLDKSKRRMEEPQKGEEK